MAESSDKTAHLVQYQWKPGSASPNPGGRPKGLSTYIREKTLDGRNLVDFLINVQQGSEKVFSKMTDRLKACEMLLSYGLWPKVASSELGNPDMKPLLDLSQLTEQELQFLENVRLGLIAIHERVNRGAYSPPV